MSKKHFQLIAEILAKIENKTERREMAEMHAAKFIKINPRFDKSRFFAACGL